MGAPLLPTWTQDHYCFYQSDGSTQVGTADTQTTLDTDTIYYCAVTVSDTTDNKAVTLTGKPQFNLAGAGWVDVSTTTAVQFANGSLTDGDATQNSSAIAGIGTFLGSRVYESSNITAIIFTLPGDETDNHGEAWFGLLIDAAQVSDGQEVLLRWVEGDGTAFTGAYTDADVDISEAAAEDNLLADDVQSTSEITSPVITQEQVLLADNTQSISEVTLPIISESYQLLADNTETSSEVTAPIFTQSNILSVIGTESGVEITSPVVAQEQILLSTNTESLSDVSLPVVSQSHAFLTNDVQSSSELTSPVLAVSAYFVLEGSIFITAGGEDTTAQLTSPAGKTTGDFTPGRIQDDENPTDAIDPALNNYTEVEWCSSSVPGIADGGYDFRITINGTPLDVYSVTPTITISSVGEDILLANDVESVSEITTPAFIQGHELNANNTESISEVTNPVVSESHLLSASGVQSISEVSIPVFTQENTFDAVNIEVASEISIPALIQENSLLAEDIESTSELVTPVVGQEHVLSVNDVQSTSEITNPELIETADDVLLADDVESASEIVTPSIGQEHNLLADDTQSVSEVSIPVASQEHILLVGDIQSTSEITNPVLIENIGDALLADDVQSTSEVATPLFTQIHVFDAVNADALSEVDTPVVGQKHTLLVDDIQSLNEVSNPVLSEAGHVLLANDIESASEVDSPALNEIYVLVGNDAESVSEVSIPAFWQDHTISADNIQSASEVTAPVLSGIEEVFGGTYNTFGGFPVDSTVTITLIEPVSGSIVALNSNVCTEFNNAPGVYVWDTSKLEIQPIEYKEYLYLMTDGVNILDGKIVVLSTSDSQRIKDIHGQVARELWYDSDITVNGNGYQQTPYKVLNDLIDDAESSKITTMNIYSDVTLNRDFKNIKTRGIGMPTFDAAGYDLFGSEFWHLQFEGLSTSPFIIQQCHILAGAGLYGHVELCTFDGNCILTGPTHIIEGISDMEGDAYISIDTNGYVLQVTNWHRSLGISNMTSGIHTIEMYGGQLHLDSSCTGGIVYLRGDYSLPPDNLGDTLIIDQTGWNAIWSHPLALSIKKFLALK